MSADLIVNAIGAEDRDRLPLKPVSSGRRPPTPEAGLNG